MADNKKSSISRRSTCYLINLKQPETTSRRLKLSFQRTAATVSVLKSDRKVEGVVGFLDVSETGAGIFTPELLHKGSHVELSITEPSPLKVRGIVAWSIPVSSGIHEGRFRCRSGIQFVLEGEDQIEAVRNFVSKASQDPIENFRLAMAAAKEAAASAGDAASAAGGQPGAPEGSEEPAGEKANSEPAAAASAEAPASPEASAAGQAAPEAAAPAGAEAPAGEKAAAEPAASENPEGGQKAA